MVVNRRSKWHILLWSVLVFAMAGVVAPQASLAQVPIIWNLKTVDTVGNVGFDTSIARDAGNNVHISYWDQTNGLLKYATNASGTFQVFTADTTIGRGEFSSIAVQANGTVNISYYDAEIGALRYARGTAAAGFVSVLVDDGAPDGLGGTADVGLDTSIAMDSLGNVHISYYDFTNGRLLHATGAPAGPFVITPVDGGTPITNDVGEFTSLALGAGNTVHISYYDVTNGTLKYANNVGGAFVAVTVDAGGGVNDVGQDSSIALDSNGRVHISYYDATALALKYANNVATPGTFVPADHRFRSHWGPGDVHIHCPRLQRPGSHQLPGLRERSPQVHHQRLGGICAYRRGQHPLPRRPFA